MYIHCTRSCTSCPLCTTCAC